MAATLPFSLNLADSSEHPPLLYQSETINNGPPKWPQLCCGQNMQWWQLGAPNQAHICSSFVCMYGRTHNNNTKKMKQTIYW